MGFASAVVGSGVSMILDHRAARTSRAGLTLYEKKQKAVRASTGRCRSVRISAVRQASEAPPPQAVESSAGDEMILNKLSSRFTQHKSHRASQAIPHGVGLTAEDLNNSQIGISSVWNEGNTCNMQLLKSGFERENSLALDNPTNRDATRQGSTFGRLGREDGNDVHFQQVEKSFLRLPAFYLASLLLALGLCFSFCKPALAKNVERTPTVTATLNEKGEVEVEDRELENSEEEMGKDNEHKSEKDDGFEAIFGEGSDLTSDPTEVLLRSYLERHPTDVKALQALLYMRLKKGEINAAMSVIDKLVEAEPQQLEWKYIKAQALEFVGDLEQARAAFQEILEFRPLSARALQGLAVVMQKNGEDEQALQLLVEAVKRAVDTGEVKEASNLRMLLGQMHTIQGNLDEAMEQYKTVVEADPQDYRPYLCQGLVYSIIGEEDEAEKQFKRYRKLCPKDFPHRGFLDELMLKAKTESRKLNERLRKEEEFKAKGKKMPKPMRQPLATGSTKKEDSVEK